MQNLESRIIDFVKEAFPSNAYLVGFNECAGKLFVPTDANVRRALGRVRSLRRKATTGLERGLLDSLEAALLFDEPHPVLDDLVGTIFAHLAKEGINEVHLLSLMEDAGKSLDACTRRYSKRKLPTAVKALTLYRLDGALDILRTVKAEVSSSKLKGACDSLSLKVSKYVELFDLDGWGKGEFANAERIFRTHGFDLGRKKFYPIALKKGFDYDQSYEELERDAISWIDDELPAFRRLVERLAKRFGCEATAEAVESKINERMVLDPKKLLKTTLEMRKVVQRFVNQNVHGINPRYNTKVIETPSYLTGVIPTGAAQFYDTFTKRPFQYYFQTTDPKRDPDKSVAALLNLLVHEEYGHCVHHSNSALGFVGKLPKLQLMGFSLMAAPITEGLSFNRELEFLEASKKLESKKRLTKAEKDYVSLMDKYGGIKLVNLETEFMVRRWRMTRFLRVVGDVRINSAKQGLLEFLDWANKYTGIPRSSMYFQLFPAHEGLFPGYATTYAVVGQEIRAIEKKIEDPKKRVKFSTYLCSIGFPPRSMYIELLQRRAAKLR